MHRFIALLLILPLVGCAASSSVATPSPSSGAAAGPPLSTAADAPPLSFPAPLYVLDNGQVARIEPDGKSRALVTKETIEVQGFPPVSTFAISAQGTLAFVVGDLKADRLVLAGLRGEDRRVLYEHPDYQLSDLVWSLDGSQIYLRLLNNKQPPDIPSGIYRIELADGQLHLVRSDDPVDDPVNPSRTINGYRPSAISPDGTRLLIEIYSLYYDGCRMGVMAPSSGDIVHLTPATDLKTYCGDAIWSPDGMGIYFLVGTSQGPSIWRADAASGAAQPLTSLSVLARAPWQMPDGALRFVLVTRDVSAGKMQFALAELALGQSAPTIRAAAFSEPLGQVLWAADGSGVVVSVVPTGKTADLRWVPVGGDPVSLPNTNNGIVDLAWGPHE
ncbi:MAG: hypothetical protein HGA65_02425 [Oscillochloris sp.]|nr:hypothetical protein [Oscillochloris sp.]